MAALEVAVNMFIIVLSMVLAVVGEFAHPLHARAAAAVACALVARFILWLESLGASRCAAWLRSFSHQLAAWLRWWRPHAAHFSVGIFNFLKALATAPPPSGPRRCRRKRGRSCRRRRRYSTNKASRRRAIWLHRRRSGQSGRGSRSSGPGTPPQPDPTPAAVDVACGSAGGGDNTGAAATTAPISQCNAPAQLEAVPSASSAAPSGANSNGSQQAAEPTRTTGTQTDTTFSWGANDGRDAGCSRSNRSSARTNGNTAAGALPSWGANTSHDAGWGSQPPSDDPSSSTSSSLTSNQQEQEQQTSEEAAEQQSSASEEEDELDALCAHNEELQRQLEEACEQRDEALQERDDALQGVHFAEQDKRELELMAHKGAGFVARAQFAAAVFAAGGAVVPPTAGGQPAANPFAAVVAPALTLLGKFDRVMGQGGMGMVLQGRLHNGAAIAVKTLPADDFLACEAAVTAFACGKTRGLATLEGIKVAEAFLPATEEVAAEYHLHSKARGLALRAMDAAARAFADNARFGVRAADAVARCWLREHGRGVFDADRSTLQSLAESAAHHAAQAAQLERAFVPRAVMVTEAACFSVQDLIKAGGHAGQGGLARSGGGLVFVLRALQDSASALHVLHSEGIGHHDLKPDNILMLLRPAEEARGRDGVMAGASSSSSGSNGAGAGNGRMRLTVRYGDYGMAYAPALAKVLNAGRRPCHGGTAGFYLEDKIPKTLTDAIQGDLVAFASTALVMLTGQPAWSIFRDAATSCCSLHWAAAEAALAKAERSTGGLQPTAVESAAMAPIKALVKETLLNARTNLPVPSAAAWAEALQQAVVSVERGVEGAAQGYALIDARGVAAARLAMGDRAALIRELQAQRAAGAGGAAALAGSSSSSDVVVVAVGDGQRWAAAKALAAEVERLSLHTGAARPEVAALAGGRVAQLLTRAAEATAAGGGDAAGLEAAAAGVKNWFGGGWVGCTFGAGQEPLLGAGWRQEQQVVVAARRRALRAEARRGAASAQQVLYQALGVVEEAEEEGEEEGQEEE